VSFAIPIAVAALGKKRLLDIVEALATKPPARLNDTERRILTLAQWAATRLSPDLPVLPGRTGASPSQPAPPPGFVASPLPLGSPALHPHALFGTALFELVEYVDLFSGSAAVSSFMRTGSPDPAVSRAGVDPIAFVLELGRIARANAATPDDQRNAERAVLGAMAAVAADVIVNPILSALPEGSPVPARSLPGDLIAAIEAEALQSLFGSPSRSAWVEMWPTAEQIPLELIAAYAEAIGAYYSDASIISSAGADTPARPAREELLYAYPAFRNLVLGPWGKWETWGYTLLVVGLPMVATLPLLLALPETNRLLTTDPASEREGDATIDIFSLGYTFGLIPPFAASIILHVMLPNEREHTSASFWIAGVRFLAGDQFRRHILRRAEHNVLSGNEALCLPRIAALRTSNLCQAEIQ